MPIINYSTTGTIHKYEELKPPTYWCASFSNLSAVKEIEPSPYSSSVSSPCLFTFGMGPGWNSDPVGIKLGSIENLRTVFVIFNLFCKLLDVNSSQDSNYKKG